MSNIDKLIEIAKNSIELAERGNSKLTNDVFRIHGMSGVKGRHFLNNIVGMTENARYLEIGCWKGSTLISALCNNSPQYHAAIDDFSEFEGPRNEFYANCKKHLPNPVNFIEADCFSFDPIQKGIKDINVYFFDGLHTAESHEKSITHFHQCLQDEFILIVDDWSWPDPQQGTIDGLFKSRIEVVYFEEPGTPAVIQNPAPPENPMGWWNGMLVAVCKKV
jgi:SAM-dependent methyltransferase